MSTSNPPIDPSSWGEEPFSFVSRSLPLGQVRVHRVRGREEMSRPYVFDLTVSSPLEGPLAGRESDALLGQSVALVMRVGGPARSVHGVVTSVRTDGLRRTHGAQLRVRVEPRFALLGREHASRIFQDATVPDVVRSVLTSFGIPTEWRLTRDYPARPFITQYRESTRAFVERLLAEAGISYAFAHPLALLRLLDGGGVDGLDGAAGTVADALLDREVMVFSDAMASSLPMDAAGVVLQFTDRTGVSTAGASEVTAFALRRALRTNRVHFRDYDPDRPQLALASSAPMLPSSPLEAVGELIGEVEAATGIDLPNVHPQPTLEDYQHGGDYLFPEWMDVQAEAGTRLRARRRRAEVGEGGSRCSALSPGLRFALEGYPILEQNQEYTVIAVRHRGAVGRGEELYSNVFECVPASHHYPPARPAPRCVQSSHTAVVVGPPGEEIHVDEWGRIKVRFHWDRRGTSETTCWLRTMQGWSGEGWGTQFIPRVGMEVVVAFEGGDPDCPIVIGCVNNRTHPPAFSLPADKTRSGIRTKTYKGGGHNELSFQDATAKEQIYLHAQRDLDEVVENDHTLAVKANESIRIDGDRKDHVQKSAAYVVAGARSEIVEGDVTIGHRSSRVDAITKDLDQRIGGVRTTRVATRDDLEVQGVAEHRFAKDVTTRVSGNATLVVGQSDAPRSLSVHIEGVGAVSAADVLELIAEKGLTLRCGKTTLRVSAEGIELSGGSIRVAGKKGTLEVGDSGLKLLSGDGYAHFDDKILIKTANASVSMGDEVKLDGTRILLNAPDKANDDPPPLPEPLTEIVLVDKNGDPLPNQRFLIELEGGGERCGVTDKEGKAKLDLPTGGKIRFPELSNVAS
ncbi:MAG: type VI secretion system tip protein TssI/VgrG [Polyangiaceae bacterium]